MDYLIPVLIFITVLLLFEVGYFFLRGSRLSEKRAVRTRLKSFSADALDEEKVDILRKDRLSDIPWFQGFLQRFPVMKVLALWVEQAGLRRRPGLYVLIALVLALIGYLAGGPFQSSYFPLVPSHLIRIPCAGILAAIPFLFIRYKRRKRFQKFEEQLPEVLDLIARSLRAGHAFTSGLSLASQEMDPPVSDEFQKTLNEINFGLSTQDALINLTRRIPLEDLGFFVISVNLQRETGGNLAEILGNLARLIRERFKLNGHVRVLSSQSRLSGYILAAIPFVVALGLQLVNPKYFEAFFEYPTGKVILAAGVVWMVIGILVMKRLVNIRV